MGFNIYTSNRMENLVAALADLLATPLPDPLAAEQIIVQSRGMQRWLTMELARYFGVCANLACPFPNSFIQELFSYVLADTTGDEHYTPEQLTWRILKILPELLTTDVAKPLVSYCKNDHDGIASLQLAQRIADYFDQYSLFRPEMLKRWESKNPLLQDNEKWQAELWRKILSETGGNHRAQLLERFCSQLSQEKELPAVPYKRVTLFGISYLPPYHLYALKALSRFVEVNLFLLSPTREYWADIRSRRQQLGLPLAKEPLFTEGNPLLASLGRQGREFSELILDLDAEVVQQLELYHEPGDGCLLHSLQSDILNLRGADDTKQSLCEKDNSLIINSCHSPMREIEVLHDHLLALLDNDSKLVFRDIIVMAPDIELYAPFITAIFDSNRDHGRYIPYSIADRRLINEGEISKVMLKLLELPGSRLSSVQLLDILSVPAVHEHFGLAEGDLPLIRNWLEDSGIRWGLDEHDRQQKGLPPFRDHSWYAGLDRLLLGLAMPDKGELFAGILPYGAMEGTITVLLGGLVSFVKAIEKAVARLSQNQTLASWSTLLLDLLNDFLMESDETAKERAVISEIASNLHKLSEQSGFIGLVTPAQFSAWCSSRLQQQEQGQGFITGGVTFCAMLPMRSIPFKVVALIGMSDGGFPRRSQMYSFDLMQQSRRPGDRSLRDEDRYLFLESLLSAREHLYISYVGQSIKDDSCIPPSVLVSELIDAVSRRFITQDGIKMEDRLITRHPLQPFSNTYFTPGAPIFSYAMENCSHLETEQADKNLFFAGAPLPPTVEYVKQLQLEQLIRFFKNPCRAFMEQRLDIRTPYQQKQLEELEPFALNGLENYQLRTSLLNGQLAGHNPEKQFALMRSAGLLPPGSQGKLLFAQELAFVSTFANQLAEQSNGHQELEPLDFELAMEGITIIGSLKQIYDHQRLRYRCAKLKATDLLATWLEHLLLNCLEKPGYPASTLLVQIDDIKEFKPFNSAAEALSVLEELLQLYMDGLTAPLPFFPETSLVWAKEKSVQKAQKKWEDGFNYKGEENDYYFQRCFKDQKALDERFCTVSETVFTPLFNCLNNAQGK